MKLQKAVGLRICNLLIKHKISRYQLCKKINLSEQAYSSYKIDNELFVTIRNLSDDRKENLLNFIKK